MIYRVSIFCLLMCFGSQALHAATPQELQKLLDRKEYEKLDEALEGVLQNEAPDVRTLKLAIKAYEEQGRFVMAATYLNKLLKVAPKQPAEFLIDAAKLNEKGADYPRAVARYKSFLAKTDKSHARRKEVLTNLIRLQVTILNRAETASAGLVEYFKTFGYDPTLYSYAIRTLKAYESQGNAEPYYELVGTLFDTFPKDKHEQVLQHYWNGARNSSVRYESDGFRKIAQFLLDHKVSSPTYAVPLLKGLAVDVDKDRPGDRARKRRLNTARQYGRLVIKNTPPQKWPEKLLSNTLMAFSRSREDVKDEGAMFWAALDGEVAKTNDVNVYREYLSPITRDNAMPASPRFLATAHKYIEKLGVGNAREEVLALHRLRQFMAQQKLPDTDAARKELSEALKLYPSKDLFDRFMEVNTNVPVLDVLKGCQTGCSAQDWAAILNAAVIWAGRQKSAEQVNTVAKMAISFYPYHVVNDTLFANSYYKNSAVPTAAKVETLAGLMKQFPKSDTLKAALVTTEKWLRREQKIGAADQLKAAMDGGGAAAKSPWSMYPDFAAAAEQNNVDQYAKLAATFVNTYKPDAALPPDSELKPANVVADLVFRGLPADNGWSSAEVLKGLAPVIDKVWSPYVIDHLAATKQWDKIKPMAAKYITANLAQRQLPFTYGELESFKFIKHFYTACNSTNDMDSLVKVVTALIQSDKVPNRYRLHSLQWVGDQLRRRNKSYPDFLNNTLLKMPVAKFAVSPADVDAFLEHYKNLSNGKHLPEPSLLDRLGDMARAAKLSPVRIRTLEFETVRRCAGRPLQVWFDRNLKANFQKLPIEERRHLLKNLYTVAVHEGWSNTFTDGKRNDIAINKWLPVEQEWLKNAENPQQSLEVAWATPWQHAWNFYSKVAKEDEQLKGEWETKIINIATVATTYLPRVRGPQLEIVAEAARLLAAQKNANALVSMLGVLGRSSTGEGSGDLIKGLSETFASNGLGDLASGYLMTILNSGAELVPSTKKIAEVQLAQYGKALGMYRIPVDRTAKEYDLYLAAQAFSRGDKSRAKALFEPKRELLVKHWEKLNPEFVIFAVNWLRKSKEYKLAMDTAMTILLSETDLPPELASAVGLCKGDIFRDQEKYPLAIVEYKSLINNPSLSQTPAGQKAHFHLVDTYRITRNYEMGKVELERIINSAGSTQQADAYYHLALINFDQEQLDEASDYLNEVFKRRATDNDATLLKGKINLKRRHFHKASELEIGVIMEQESVVPGKHLTLKLADPNLGVARSNDAIPVVVVTDPGGDREVVKLRAREDNRSVFEGRVSTRLGVPEAGNFFLEVGGKDTVRYSLEPEFQRQNNLKFDAHSLIVVSDAKLDASSGQFVTEEEQKKRDLELELKRRAGEISKQEVGRNSKTIRPGNDVYVQVEDPDHDISNEPDMVKIDVETSSGDRIFGFEVKETGAHTGIFEGRIATATPLPRASASDSAEGKEPGWVINSKKAQTWSSAPDGIKPKWFEVDLQRSNEIEEVIVDFVNRRNVKKMVLFGARYKDDYRPLAFYPKRQRRLGGIEVSAVLGGVLREPEDIRARMMTSTNFEGSIGYARLRRALIDKLKGGSVNVNYRMFGYFYVAKAQTFSMRSVSLAGTNRASVFINGRLVSEENDITFDVPLSKGIHELEILMQCSGHDTTYELQHINPRGEWQSLPEEWFAPSKHPELKKALEAKAQITFAGENMIIKFNKDAARQRKFRLLIHDYAGDSFSIREFKVVNKAGKTLVPGTNDFSSGTENDKLEISAGDEITVSYQDRRRLTPDKPLHTVTLDSSFFNGEISLNLEELNEQRRPIYHPVKRVKTGDTLIIRAEDWDLDETDERDVIQVKVQVSGKKPVILKGLESEKHSGEFLTTIKFRKESKRPDELVIGPNEEILISYLDEHNTDPGSDIEREYHAYEAGNTVPKIIALNTFTQLVDADEEEEDKRSIRRKRKDEESRKVLKKEILSKFPEGADPVSRTAIDAPLLFFVQQPSAAMNELSKYKVRIYTSAMKDAKAAGTNVTPAAGELPLKDISHHAAEKGIEDLRFINLPELDDNIRLEKGLFAGAVRLQLGKLGDPIDDLVIPTRPVMDITSTRRGRRRSSKKVQKITIPTVIVQGNDTLIIEAEGGGKVVQQKLQLYCEGRINFLDRSWESPKEGIYLGERLFIQVIDLDLDVSDEYDTINVKLEAAGGDKLTLPLRETLAHSGIFTGSILPEYKPEGKGSPEDDILHVNFGEDVVATFADANHADGNEPVIREARCKIYLGSDSTVNTFSKRFKDKEIAVKTAFTIAESYFELAKEHRKLEKEELADSEIQIGKRLLEEAIENFPNTKYVAQAEYLLANLAQETGKYEEAIGRYTSILHHWAESEFAPKAQFKLGLCYEKMTPPQFDNACEEYVKVTYKYPDHPLVADVIIRLGQYFFRAEQYEVSGDVFKSFQERFPDHRLSSRALLLSGQSYIKAQMNEDSVEVLNQLVDTYADDKTVRSEAMYWLADSYMRVNDNEKAYQTFKKLTWDYPETKWAKMARGRLVEDVFSRMEDM